MPKGNTKAKRRDKYYYLAKDQGFRSRAAFKLVQLNKKHDFLSSSRALIDLCAAPGGWLQVAAKYMPVSSIIIGVDLVPIKPIHNVITLQEDITTPRCRAAIKKHLQQMNADVVICDGAPNMGKAWLQDAYTQVDLVLKALKLATDFLRPGGTFVTKVFRSADYNALLYVFHQFFKKVEATKPPASRNTSAEIYVVCTHYLAPDKIDPRLLDSKHVFKDLDMPLKKPDIFAPTKKKIRPNQSGYEEGNYTLFKSVSVAELIEAKDPISVLASFNQLAFDDTARALGLDRHASAEIQACCQDLKVLNKKDFKNLLKWRLRVRAILHPEEAEAKAKAAAGGGGDDDDDAMANVEVKPISREAIEEQLDKELEDKMTELDRKKKREKKKERARKAKLRQRVALGMENPGDGGVQAQEEDLFSVTTVTSSADGDVTALLDQAPDEVLESPVDSEEENEWAGRDYDQYLDHQLDSMYDAYLERTKKRAPPAEKKKKFKMGDEADDLPEDERFGGEEDDEEDEEEDGERRVRFALEEDGEAAPVSKKAKQAALWFSRGIFQDVGAIDDDDDDDDDDSDDDVDETEFGGKRGRKRTAEDDEEKQDDDEDEEDDDEEKPKNKKQRQEATKDKKSKKNKKNKKNKDDEDGEAGALDEFEVVPLARSDSEDEDSSEPEPESDLDEVATTLAIGKKYFLTKKRKREFEDDAYNRYAFDDGDDLPPWFVQDENRHNKPQKPVTKEEVEAEKARFRELNERPIKKVAEAKARKRLRMVKKVEKMKQKAAKIATAEGMSEREKIKSIRTLQKHTLGKAGDANAAPVYIVRTKHQTAQSRKGPSAGKNAKVKIVDPRLKKDKRGEQRAAKKRGGARGGRGGRGGKRR